jgi:hypothetical protein
VPLLPNSFGGRRVLRYEAQPTRMFGSYSVTAHYDDGTVEALAYGDPHYCLAEAARRNGELKDGTDGRALIGTGRGSAAAGSRG